MQANKILKIILKGFFKKSKSLPKYFGDFLRVLKMGTSHKVEVNLQNHDKHPVQTHMKMGCDLELPPLYEKFLKMRLAKAWASVATLGWCDLIPK